MKKVFILIMALSIMIAANIYAQGGNSSNSGQRQNSEQTRSQKGSNPKLDLSKLSAAQRAEIKAIQKKYEIDLSNLSLDIKKQENVIKAEMMKSNPNKTTINAAIDAKSSLEAQRAKLKMEEMIEIKAVIHPATAASTTTTSSTNNS